MVKRIIVIALLTCLVIGTVPAQGRENARDLIAQGREHMSAARYDQAVRSFERALELQPRNRDAPPLLEQARRAGYDDAMRQMRNERDTARQLELINQALTFRPDDVRAVAERDRLQASLRQEEEQQRLRANPTEITSGSPHNASLQAGGRHYYSVTVPVTVQLTAFTESSIDTVMTLFDAAEAQIATDDDSGSGSNARISREVPAGAYIIEVRGYDGRVSGPYTLNVTANASHSATLRAGDWQRYSVTVPEPALLTAFTESRIDTVMTLFDAAGGQIATDDDSGSGSNARISREVPAGAYIIEVRGYDGRVSGPYTLHISPLLQLTDITEAERVAERTRPLRDEDFAVRQNPDNTITITGFNLSNRDVVIPERLYDLPVTQIGDSAFSRKGLTGVVIPNTVTAIGRNAFSDNQLVSVTIGSRVRTIGNNAFGDNRTLTTITIPNSVTEIAAYAFDDCGLTEVTFGTGLRTIGGWAFKGNRLTSVTLPNGIREVLNQAFADNNIQSVSIPGSIQTLGGVNDWGAAAQAFGVAGLQGVAVFAGAFEGNPVTRAILPANMSSDNLRNFEESLRNFYTSQNMAAGTYVKNGPVWTRQ